MLQQLLSLRKQYNEGSQEDYFDHPHLIGWTRHTETKAMVIIMTNSTGGIKPMYVLLIFFIEIIFVLKPLKIYSFLKKTGVLPAN